MITDFEIRENIKNKLYELRIENDMTQTEFGNLTGKKKTTVASWEQGKTLPDVASLYQYAKIFNKTMDYMYGIERGD